LVVFVDESQDAQRFVLGAVVSDVIVALTMTVGRFRTMSRRLGVRDALEFHERDLYHHHPRLLTAAVVYLMLSLAIGRVGLRMARRAAAYR
jgi:hypothetical protein